MADIMKQETRTAELAPLQASDNAVVVYLARLASAHSRRTMLGALSRVLYLAGHENTDPVIFTWTSLRYQHVQAIRTRLMEKYAPATVNATLAAVRGVLKEAWRLGQLTAEDYNRAVDVEDVKSERIPPGKVLAYDAMTRLFAACKSDPSPAGARDAALLGVMVGCGLRRSEVTALDLADVGEDDSLRVRAGKGAKDRIVYLSNGSRDAVRRWIEVRGSEPGPLFFRIPKGGRLPELRQRMTTQAVWHIVEHRGNQGSAAIRPHDLRRTFVTRLLDAGVDVLTVQRLAGHADPRTTGRYDRRGEDAKRRAVDALDIPY